MTTRPAEGTAAAPIDARSAVSTTVACVMKLRSAPRAWAMKSAPTHSKTAVPSMFTVAPMGSTKDDTLLETPTFSRTVLDGDRKRRARGTGREGHQERLEHVAEVDNRRDRAPGRQPPSEVQQQRQGDEEVNRQPRRERGNILCQGSERFESGRAHHPRDEGQDTDGQQLDDAGREGHHRLEEGVEDVGNDDAGAFRQGRDGGAEDDAEEDDRQHVPRSGRIHEIDGCRGSAG